MENAEAVTGFCIAHYKAFAGIFGTDIQEEVQTIFADSGYWNVFTFSFIEGSPFSEADFQAALPRAVISESLSKKLFAGEASVGRSLLLNGQEFRVCGVVKDVSFVTPRTCADIWIPYTTSDELVATHPASPYIGPFGAYILASPQKKSQAITEVREAIHRYNQTDSEHRLSLWGQPDTHLAYTLRERSYVEINWKSILFSLGTMLFALLFIPAINLSGMIFFQVNRRFSEYGLRKAFGASGRNIFSQVLIENLLFTGVGALVGLLLSYIIMYSGRNWIPFLFNSWSPILPEGVQTTFTPEMLFSPLLFGIVLLGCVLLNVLSAALPAYLSQKKILLIHFITRDKAMTKQIIKQMWNQKKINVWLFLEIVLVSFFLWSAVDSVYVLLSNRYIKKRI
ncbi:MAG: ABC transporter permease [Bacteroides sp.]|nr:ABC transporter permease [Bacteroides sp.]